MANISKWFGYPIYITKLENFESINKKIVPIILRDITPTNSQYSTTTDVKPKELHLLMIIYTKIKDLKNYTLNYLR